MVLFWLTLKKTCISPCRVDLCGRQQWPWAGERSSRGIDEDAGWGRAAGCCPSSLCQQTGIGLLVSPPMYSLFSALFHQLRPPDGHTWCDFVQDLPNAMNAAEITDKLGLHSLRHRNWYIQATCATSGDGLYEGLDWLANQLKNKKWRVRSVEWGRAWVPAPGSGYIWSIVFTWRGSAKKNSQRSDSQWLSPPQNTCFILINLFCLDLWWAFLNIYKQMVLKLT